MRNIKLEDYLKNIYELLETRQKATTSFLAQKMSLAPASVTEMVKRLANKGLVDYKPYAGVELSTDGLAYALQVVRKHRLWEMFLYKILNYSWDEIHQEAEMLEHLMSEKLEAKLDKMLGHPKFDPHGHPIPDKKGRIPKVVNNKPLAHLQELDEGNVIQVDDSDSQLLSYLTRLGIKLNQKIHVKEKRSFDGSMLITVQNKDWNISRQVAEHIYISF